MKKFMKKLAKKAEGFTLVELIVVIAILGILAGIAVPAYTGYLNKANKASDDTQIAAMNTAIDAACALHGFDSSTASGTFENTTTIKTLTAGTTSTNIKGDYDTFYPSTNAFTLDYYASLEFSGGNVVGKGTK